MDIALVLLGTLIALAVGLAIKYGVEYFGDGTYDITWIEYAIAAAVILCIVAPLVTWGGQKLAIQNQLTYHENWGGFEYSVSKVVHYCHESDSEGGDTGGCSRTFDADSYTVEVPYQDCTTTTDSKGRSTTTCVTRYREETRWRQVPWTQTETTWLIHTTLGDYVVGDNWLEDNPQAHRIHPEYDSPDSLPGDYQSYTGTPQLWTQANDRINAGDPGPVFQRHDYANYLLASQSTILKQYSNSIDTYLKAKQLPALSKDPIFNYYYDNQVYFVGVNQPAGNWQFELDQLNGALGSTLQGNLYLVVVNADQITNPDNYIGALAAYWEGPAFGKDAISKNAIIVVVGTKDGSTVAWARAKTGMPVGNEQMLLDLQYQLPGTALTPQALIGHPKATITQDGKGKFHVALTHSNGAIEKVLWGPNAFQRVCMTCTSAADKANGKNQVGYEYLKSQIKPTGWQKFWICFFTALFSCVVWGVCIAVGVPTGRAIHSSIRNRYSR